MWYKISNLRSIDMVFMWYLVGPGAENDHPNHHGLYGHPVGFLHEVARG